MLVKIISRKKIGVVVVVLAFVSAAFVMPANAATTRDILFPVEKNSIEKLRWSDTYGAPRSGGRSHKGVDLLGKKMMPIIAVKDSVVTWGHFRNSSGNSLMLQDADGWEYMYVHFNNDTPGTDDASAKCTDVYSAKLCATVQSGGKLARGTKVKAGEIIGYMGDSGNAEGTSPHLHFEIHTPNGVAINPTASVNAARAVSAATPQTEASVARLYRSFFHRKPDEEGKVYWLGKVAEGYSLEEIAEWFAQSPEYQKRYEGKSFEQFLDILYKDVLKRPSDKEGKAYWLGQLEAKKVTRGTIVVYFSESEEMLKRFP